MQITDKRNVQFQNKRADVFKGSGQVLGGDTKPSRLVPSNLPALATGNQRLKSQNQKTGSPRYVPASVQENKSTMMVENEDGDAELEVESELPGAVK